jgi:hypothetical protein
MLSGALRSLISGALQVKKNRSTNTDTYMYNTDTSVRVRHELGRGVAREGDESRVGPWGRGVRVTPGGRSPSNLVRFI